MAGFYVRRERRSGMIMVPERFLREFMPKASGEFVKVYLLLLARADRGEDLSVSVMADILYNTEKDVLRALKYWESMKLLRLEYDLSGELLGLSILEDSDGELAVTKEPEFVAVKKTEEKPDLMALQNDEDFCQLLYLAGRYTGRTLTCTDCDVLGYLYGTLKMGAELLEYLVESCVSGGHTSIQYIEKVGLSWHERGIVSVEQAKAEAVIGRKHTYAVLKAFGLGGRNPADGEREIIDKWFREYGFPVEVVLEACDRTMRTIHQPSFQYADRILQVWKENGVRHKSDIVKLDEKRKEGNRGPEKKTETKRPNGFHNFTPRDYDCDELVKELNGF